MRFPHPSSAGTKMMNLLIEVTDKLTGLQENVSKKDTLKQEKIIPAILQVLYAPIPILCLLAEQC